MSGVHNIFVVDSPCMRCLVAVREGFSMNSESTWKMSGTSSKGKEFAVVMIKANNMKMDKYRRVILEQMKVAV